MGLGIGILVPLGPFWIAVPRDPGRKKRNEMQRHPLHTGTTHRHPLHPHDTHYTQALHTGTHYTHMTPTTHRHYTWWHTYLQACKRGASAVGGGRVFFTRCMQQRIAYA